MGMPSWLTAKGARTSEPTHVPAATVASGALRASVRDDRIAATAQVTAISASNAVAMTVFAPSAVSGAPTSTAVPIKPSASPPSFSADRRSPPTRKCARNAVQTGAVAPNTETMPLGTYCSDQKMIAQLVPVLKIPTTAAAASSRPRGNRCRRSSASAVSTIDTAMPRSNAKTNGGTSSMPILIAAQVDPHTST